MCVWYMLVGVCLVYVAEGCVSGVCWWGVLVGVCVSGVCWWVCMCVWCVLWVCVSGVCWWGVCVCVVYWWGVLVGSCLACAGGVVLVCVWGWGVQTPAPCVCGSGWARLGAEVRSDLGPGGAPAVPRVP